MKKHKVHEDLYLVSKYAFLGRQTRGFLLMCTESERGEFGYCTRSSLSPRASLDFLLLVLNYSTVERKNRFLHPMI